MLILRPNKINSLKLFKTSLKSRVYASKGPLLIHWEGQATPHPQGGGMVSLPRKSLLEKSSQ